MLLICCFLIERLLTFTLECFAWLSCYVNLCFCLPQRLFRRQQPGCDVTPTECFFVLKKDKINGLNVNWPFSMVYHGQLCRQHKCGQILNGYVSTIWTILLHLDIPWPLSDPFQLSHNELKGMQTAQRPSLSLSPVCVSGLWNLEWQRSDVSCGFYLVAQPEKALTVWHCAVAVSQSVCPSVIQNQSRMSLNKTGRRSSSSCVLLST